MALSSSLGHLKYAAAPSSSLAPPHLSQSTGFGAHKYIQAVSSSLTV